MYNPYLGDVAREVPGRTGDLRRTLARLEKSLSVVQERLREAAASASSQGDGETAQHRRRLASALERDLKKVRAEQEALRTEEEARAERRSQMPAPVDYEQYAVDSSVPHTIAEDLTNRRPAAYSLQGVRREADTWKQILVEVCGELGRQDPMLFQTLGEDPELQGRRRPRLTAEPGMLLTPARVPDANMYVETHLSTRQMRAILRILLRRYGIPETDLLLYLDRDYSALHTPQERRRRAAAAAGAEEDESETQARQLQLDLEEMM